MFVQNRIFGKRRKRTTHKVFIPTFSNIFSPFGKGQLLRVEINRNKNPKLQSLYTAKIMIIDA